MAMYVAFARCEGQNVTDIGYVWYHTLWDLGPNPSGSSGARGGSWDDDTGFVTDPVVIHGLVPIQNV